MNDYMTDSVPVREKPFFLFILKSLENGTKICELLAKQI